MSIIKHNITDLTIPNKTAEKLNQLIKTNLYPSKKQVYNLANKNNLHLTTEQINGYLNSLEPYQLTHESHLTKAKMGHIISFSLFSIVQIDIIDFSKFSYDYSEYKFRRKLEDIQTSKNKGYKYLFILIDVFSRYIDAIPLKNKSIKETTHALQLIIDYNKIKPNVIMSDSDSSFLGKEFQDLLKSLNIKHDTVVLDNHRALGIVDRACRTIRERLTKIFIANQNTEWVDLIADVIFQINNSPNRGILNFTPLQVLQDKHAQEVIFELNSQKASRNQELRENRETKVGDFVRLKIKSHKGTEPRWSKRLYQVESKNGKRLLLNNNKEVNDDDILIVNRPNNLLTNDTNEKNIIEEINQHKSIDRKIKQEGIQRATFDEMNEPRKTRVKERVDYKKYL